MRLARATAIALALTALTAAPGSARSLVDSLGPEPGTVVLARFTAGPGSYAGLHLRVIEEAFFTTFEVGAHSGHQMFRFIGLNSRAGGGHGSGSNSAMVGAAGIGVSVPGPSAGLGGTRLNPGDYYAVGAAPSGTATFEVRGPRSTQVLGRVWGPAYSFTDVDFAAIDDTVVAAPGVDRRSVHGQVSVTARHALFASFTACPNARTEVRAPQHASGWWGPLGVSYGSPGQWIFTLDYENTTVEPEAPSWPCSNSLLALDVVLPAAAIPPG